MSFPRGPEDLTADWLGAQVGAPVRAFECEQVGVGVGVLGRLFQLRLDTGDEAPSTVIAKFPTADEGTRTNVAGPLRVYQREARFYQELADRAPVDTPAVHCADYDEDSGDFVLLLEDLSPLRAADQIAGCSVADAEIVIDAIADHHAHFARPGALHGLDWVPHIEDPVMRAVVQGMMVQSLPGFLDLFGDRLDAERRGFHEGLPETAPAFMRQHPDGDPTLTLIHTDLRLDNVFFGGADRPVVLIDWQLANRGGLAYDVAYFLSQSLETETRREHEATLVQRYLDRLAAAGVVVDRDGFDRDYRRTVAFCAIYPVTVAGSIEMANERAVELCRMLFERAMAAIDDHDALELWFA